MSLLRECSVSCGTAQKKMSNKKQEREKERLEKATQHIIIEDFSGTRILQDMAGSCFLVMFSKVTNLARAIHRPHSLDTNVQGTANENAAGIHIICKRSDQPTIACSRNRITMK